MKKGKALKFGFAPIPYPVLFAKDLSHGAKVVYGVIISYIWKKSDEKAWPSQATLRKKLEMSDPTLRKYLVELKEYGLIDWRVRGQGKTNIYWLTDFPERLNDTLKLDPKEILDQEPKEPLVQKPKEPLDKIEERNNKIEEKENSPSESEGVKAMASLATPILSRQPKEKKAKTVMPPNAPKMEVGWDAADKAMLPPKLAEKEVSAWNCNDMLSFHRTIWVSGFPQIPVPKILPQHRSNAKKWINDEGADKVKEIVQYAIDNWAFLQNRYKNLQGALPDMNVIHGYRQALAKDIIEHPERRKPSGSEFKATGEKKAGW